LFASLLVAALLGIVFVGLVAFVERLVVPAGSRSVVVADMEPERVVAVAS
jgi:hypothetical protein